MYFYVSTRMDTCRKRIYSFIGIKCALHACVDVTNTHRNVFGPRWMGTSRDGCPVAAPFAFVGDGRISRVVLAGDAALSLR